MTAVRRLVAGTAVVVLGIAGAGAALPAVAAVPPANPVIIVFRTSPSSATLQRLASAAGNLRVRRTYRGLPVVAATLTDAQAAAVDADGAVAEVVADRRIRLEPDATTPGQMTAPTPIRKADSGIGAAERKLGLDGDAANDGLTVYGPADSVIAIVDSGIDPTHPDFAGKILAFENFVSTPGAGCPTAPPGGAPWDDLGHGTHVSSIAAGTGKVTAANKGVAPGAALVVLKVFDCANSAPESDLLAAFDWLLAQRSTYGIDVVNMSFGAALAGLDGTDVLSDGANRLAAAGMVPVVAAGNSGPGSGSVGTPGVAKWALTAGAIKSNALGRNLAEFSSRGPTADGRTKPDVVTPGVDILAAAPGYPSWRYRTMSGTSMATPALSGLVALALQADPSLAPSGVACTACPTGVDEASMNSPILDLAHSTAADWNLPGPDPETGYGALNAYPFLRAAANSALAGPAPSRHFARQGHVDDRTELIWPIKATRNRTVGLGLTVPTVDGFNGPFTKLVVLGPDGAPVTLTDDCSTTDFDGGGSSSLCWYNGGAARSTGGWFTPTTTGTFHVGVRSLTGPTDFVVDIDGATQVAQSGAPLPVVLDPGPLTEGGPAAVVRIALAHAPTANTTVMLRGDGQLALPAAGLTFTPQNWATPQSLSISALDDGTTEGMHSGRLVAKTVTTRIDNTAISVPLAVTIVDNDGAAGANWVERAGLTDQGSESWGGAYEPPGMMSLVTPGGRFVAFESRAVDLVAAHDANGIRSDVYLRDRVAGTTERITIGATYGDNFLEGISDDGSKVLFSSYDSFGTVDTNADFDLFVRDRTVGTTTRVNLSEDGTQMPTRACRTDWSQFCFEMPGAISGDGSTVAFVTDAPMIAADLDSAPDVYVRDIVTGVVERVSVASDGTTGDATIQAASRMNVSLSFDGGIVGFGTSTDGLAPGERVGEFDLFVRDRVSATTVLANADAAGVAMPVADYAPGPLIAADGAHFAFASTDSATFDTSIWVRTLATGSVERVNPSAPGTANWAFPTSITADGRRVTFYTSDAAFTGTAGSVMRDLDSGVSRNVVMAMIGGAVSPAIARTSSDGAYAAWMSADANLVSGDTNDALDVFIRAFA